MLRVKLQIVKVKELDVFGSLVLSNPVTFIEQSILILSITVHPVILKLCSDFTITQGNYRL